MADEPTDTPESDQEPAETPPASEPPKGDDGTDWKAMARKHEREAKKLRTDIEDLQKLNESEAEAALRAAREEGEQTVRSTLGADLASTRLELAVLKSEDAKKLTDPSDALVFIKSDDITDDGGDIDAKALASAIDALIEAKPHLAAGPKRVTPVPGGPRGADRPDPGQGKDRLMAAFADTGK